MDLVTAATGNLATKLLQLLQVDDCKLPKGLRAEVESLAKELDSTHAALSKSKMAQVPVPPDQLLDSQIRLLARDLREASYDTVDILDAFLVRVREKTTGKHLFSGLSKLKARLKVSSAVQELRKQLHQFTDRCGSCQVVNDDEIVAANPDADDEVVAKPAASSAIDPRLQAMYHEVTKLLVGVDGAMAELISMLCLERWKALSQKLKIVSVLGTGGLGKTTLARAVFDKLRSQFDRAAFVSVGRNPDLRKVFGDILMDLDKQKYTHVKVSTWDERQLIDALRGVLRKKRYFIVVDDVWEKQSWETIRLALVYYENKGSRIILTTRNKYEVTGSEVYKPRALSVDNAKRLFYTRIFGEGKCIDNEVDEVSDKILKKCGGIPLAIVTMASLLVGKSKREWFEVCSSVGFRGKQVDRTMEILSLSYYDLPCNLRSCLLYLSVFPEDYIVDKNSLIWRWIAEGFVQKKPGMELFVVGEGYFNDLVNRSMIQAVESEQDGIIDGCRVHDMVLDLLRSLSSEENFVDTILESDEGTSSSISKACRLSHQKSTTDACLEKENNMGMEKIRSLIAFRYRGDKELQFWRFALMRVLCLEGVYMKSWHNAKHLGNLLHLRYLGIKHTTMPQLPKEIAALKFLQTLHLVDNFYIKELPSSVGQLRNLVCLHALGTNMPNGIIKKLTSLEELLIQYTTMMNNYGMYKELFKELSNLNELRVLTIKVIEMSHIMVSDLVQSIGNLHKIQSLRLYGVEAFGTVMLPRHLRHLLVRGHSSYRIPLSINPTCLINLSHLELDVINMDEQSMQTLGGLPELRHLGLSTKSTVTITNIATDGNSFFQKLRSCKFSSSMVLLVLNEDSSVSFILWNGRGDMVFGPRKENKKDDRTRGAPATVMPSLQELSFEAQWSLPMVESQGRCFRNLGLENLTSLQKVTATADCDGYPCEEDVMAAEAALRQATDVHPNHPALVFNRINENNSVRQKWKSEAKSRRAWARQTASRANDDLPYREQQADVSRRPISRNLGPQHQKQDGISRDLPWCKMQDVGSNLRNSYNNNTLFSCYIDTSNYGQATSDF